MNIKEAKEQIKNAMISYFTKDKFGNYAIPVERQRPVFLMGPPGIGKTAVMEQIASELDVALVSYSMTHHTRQSALGLPFIEKKVYGGVEYSVSEYTMSEIIASVYDMMETTGKKEGILFLDEINCVSETLAPAMLQFLQYKIFGRHRVPDGWIVVTAGNPPEYNNSVREFDIVTWDRLKRIDVEPDYKAWKEYAVNSGVHAAVTTYLDVKPDDFYSIESTVDGKNFVTARGWCDLSEMITLYEKNGLTVDEKLVAQYLQNRKIAKNFAIYYDLFNKYRSDYQIDSILDGTAPDVICERAKNARFDERLALLSLLLDSIGAEMRRVCLEEKAVSSLMTVLKEVRMQLSHPGADGQNILEKQILAKQDVLDKGKKSASLSADDEMALRELIAILKNQKQQLAEAGGEPFAVMKNDFDQRVKDLKEDAAAAGKKLSNIFVFCEKAFGEGQELLILVTELTARSYGAHFIGRYGCREYFEHNKELLFYERQKQIISELEEISEI